MVSILAAAWAESQGILNVRLNTQIKHSSSHQMRRNLFGRNGWNFTDENAHTGNAIQKQTSLMTESTSASYSMILLETKRLTKNCLLQCFIMQCC